MPFLQRTLGTAPVNGATWVALLGLALTGLAAADAHKWVRRRMARRSANAS